MPELEFIGDWTPDEAQAIAQQLQKSLGVGDGGGAEVTVQHLEDNPIQQLVSKRQKRLIELLRAGASAAFDGAALGKAADEHECGPGCAHSWDDYQLGNDALLKSVGKLKRDAQGRIYRMNANSRWERFSSGPNYEGLPEFRFSATHGAFGRGVYFPVLTAPQGYLRLRLRANLSGQELISDEQFHVLEDDFAQDISKVLDSKGVRGIVQTEGETVTLLCVRSPSDLQVLGAVADSGQLPPGPTFEYRLVKLTPAEDHWVIDVEVAPAVDGPSPQGYELLKAARVFPDSPLSGTVLTTVGTGATLDRRMVREAVERCKLDGVPVDEVQIRLVDGVPDFLPPETYVYCLPSQGTIYLAHHDPGAALAKHQRMLTRELRTATRAGMPAELALDTILAAQEIDPQWWLEHHIKRYTGAILLARRHDITTAPDAGPWGRYLGLLAGRGLAHWGNRRAIAECMAEDYRRAFDPAGLPNEVTMAWDLAVPAIARMAQQELLKALHS
jgi:hypothetical protein